MDTDADRFGVVDAGGTYYRPNQVLPMLLRYLGIDRNLTGRVIATQTGSPLLEVLAGLIPGNDAHKPKRGVVPAFVGHPFYHRRVGEREDRVYENVFMVPVGIKYIEEQRRTDLSYRFLDELPAGWRDTILIGGEESSGLTTRGHVTDKDGIWANLLIMDMVAHYGKPLAEIWQDTVDLAGWESYGGLLPSNSGRVDIDAVLEAKEGLINDFLDRFEGKSAGVADLAGLPIEGLPQLAGLKVVYAGGIRYDFVEIQLSDEQGGDQHYLRVRASGTEPINRIYVESSDPDVAAGLMQVALRRLEQLSAHEIEVAGSAWRLAEILSATNPTDLTTETTRAALSRHSDWGMKDVVDDLERMMPVAEHRNQRIVASWISILSDEI
jgi:phosphomannomutase